METSSSPHKDLKQLIQDYLHDANVMQLATVRAGQPWISTVSYVADEAWNLYWMSAKSRRHSKDLADEPRVAVAIVKDPSVKRGLQMEGSAEALTGDELRRAHQLYGKRYGDKPERLEEAISKDPNARTYYRVKPTHIKLHDEVNFPTDPQQEYSLQ